MKLKNWWNNLEDWKKGGIIGGFYAIIFFIQNLFFDLSYLVLIWFPELLITQFINLLFTGNALRYTSISILFGYLAFILVSIIVGALIGFFINKIRKKYKK